MSIKAVLWDCDGTLTISEIVHQTSIENIAQNHGIVWTQAHADRVVGTTIPNAYSILNKELNLDISLDQFMCEFMEQFSDLAPKLVKPHGNVVETFAKLKEMGIKLAVVSNAARQSTEANLSAVGLHPVNLTVVTLSDVLNPKPNPELYLRACYLLGVDPSEALVVEDSVTGVQAGLNAKIKTYVYAEQEFIDQNTYPDEVHFLGKLENIFDAIKES